MESLKRFKPTYYTEGCACAPPHEEDDEDRCTCPCHDKPKRKKTRRDIQRYESWLRLHDVYPDLSFGEYLKNGCSPVPIPRW